MRSARHWTYDISHIVMANDPPIRAEIELLPPAVGMYVLREDDVNPFGHTPAVENTLQTRRAEAEREHVIVPKRVSEEVQSIQRRPTS